MIKFLATSGVTFFIYGSLFGGIPPIWRVGIFTALFWIFIYGITYYQNKMIGKMFRRMKNGRSNM
jgi:hypothetical protein